VALSFALRAGRLTLATASLALFGIGQGLFTAPNNSAIMARAAAEESGQVGGVLMVGIPAQVLVRGAVASFIAFAALAGVAALLCFVRAENDAPRAVE
jgi:hypothetical protein